MLFGLLPIYCIVSYLQSCLRGCEILVLEASCRPRSSADVRRAGEILLQKKEKRKKGKHKRQKIK